jgi:hypothetical protein
MRMRIALALCAALALSIGVATATAAGGNSANAKLCQKGGWMNVQGSDGTQFASEDECVSYGAHGGTIVAIPASVTVSFTPTGDPDFCNVIVNLSHFTPNTQYSVSVSVQDGGIFPFGPFAVTTDSSGAGSVGIFSYVKDSSSASGEALVDASVGSVSSGFQPVAC